MISLYADEHIEKSLIVALRQKGINIHYTVEISRGLSDEEHFTHAQKEDRVILTRDDDFLKIAKNHLSHSGIIYVKGYPEIGTLLKDILALLKEQKLFQSAVWYVPRK